MHYSFNKAPFMIGLWWCPCLELFPIEAGKHHINIRFKYQASVHIRVFISFTCGSLIVCCNVFVNRIVFRTVYFKFGTEKKLYYPFLKISHIAIALTVMSFSWMPIFSTRLLVTLNVNHWIYISCYENKLTSCKLSIFCFDIIILGGRHMDFASCDFLN